MNEKYKDFVSAAQIRSARGLLNWSQDDLADASGVSITTIRKLELGHISRPETTRLVLQAFEEMGVEFIESNGVRQKPEDITIYQGIDRVKDFYDDVYQTACRKGGDVVMVAIRLSKYDNTTN